MVERCANCGVLGRGQGGRLRIWGHLLRSVLTICEQQMWPVMKAGYKLWPAVSLIQHVFIPVEQKTVVGSLVGLGWGVYLALFAAQ